MKSIIQDCKVIQLIQGQPQVALDPVFLGYGVQMEVAVECQEAPFKSVGSD